MKRNRKYFLLFVFGLSFLYLLSYTFAFWPPLQDVQTGVVVSGYDRRIWYKVYDPLRGMWVEDGQYFSGNADMYWSVDISSKDGVVTWLAIQYVPGHNGDSRVGYAVYDPVKGMWMGGGQYFSGSADRYWSPGVNTAEGVVVWVAIQYVPGHNGDSRVGYAVYDPVKGMWMGGGQYFSGGADQYWSPEIYTQDGLVAWVAYQYLPGHDGARRIGYAVYDPSNGVWMGEGGNFQEGSAVWIYIQGNTVYYVVNGVTYTRGYDHNIDSWYSGPTKPLSYFFASPTSGNPPLWVWFMDMSIGATSWSWDFDDSGSSARSPSHTFSNAGVYTVTQTVSGPAGSHSASSTITTDLVPPTGSVTINNNADYTNSVSVMLTLSATDNSGVVSSMRFSNDASSWSDWESYTTIKSWILASGDGTKNVYVQYEDATGLVSDTASDSIILDTTPPNLNVYHFPDLPDDDDIVSYVANADDTGSGLKEIKIYVYGALRKTCTSSPCEYSEGPYSTDSIHSYYSTARDNLDNEARDPQTGEKSFTVINNPPVLALIGDKTVKEGELLQFNVSATDPDNDSLTYSAQNLPNGATFINQTFSWTPSYEQAGVHYVTFRVDDGYLNDNETVAIAVFAPILEGFIISQGGSASAESGFELLFTITQQPIKLTIFNSWKLFLGWTLLLA